MSNQNEALYYLGCPIWANKDWLGSLFTKKAKPKEYLRQYSRVFNTVEANSTFYSQPGFDMLTRWRTETPKHFRFSFKFPRTISHVFKLRNVAEETKIFFDRMEPILEKTGLFFLQLPPTFSAKQFKHLEAFLPLLPTQFKYAVELRHEDYYQNDHIEIRLNTLLASHGINRAFFDTSVLHQIEAKDEFTKFAQSKKPKMPRRLIATSTKPFVRYCGYREVEPNVSALEVIANQTVEWIESGKKPYIFLHSPGDQFAPELARAFHEMIQEKMKDRQIVDLEAFSGEQEKNRPGQLSLFD